MIRKPENMQQACPRHRQQVAILTAYPASIGSSRGFTVRVEGTVQALRYKGSCGIYGARFEEHPRPNPT